jgi:hypothetical protein
MTPDKVAILEVKYAKGSEKLVLLRLKIQVARHHDPLREHYMSQHLKWQMDCNRVYNQVNRVENLGSPKFFIEALGAQVEVTKE